MRMPRLLLALFFAVLPLTALAGPPDELFERLKAAEDDAVAADIAEDIWAIWQEADSATIDLMMKRAIATIGQGDQQLSRELLDRVILIDPRFPEAWHLRAGLFLIAENFPEAIRDLNETLALEPRHFGAWMGLGYIFEQIGGKQQALESYREALRIYPLMPQALAAEQRLARETEGQDL